MQPPGCQQMLLPIGIIQVCRRDTAAATGRVHELAIPGIQTDMRQLPSDSKKQKIARLDLAVGNSAGLAILGLGGSRHLDASLPMRKQHQTTAVETARIASAVT